MNKDLKAFVRFDGQNKIVPGTLVVQSTKPKVGKWEEISAVCCSGGNPGLSGVVILNETEFVIDPVLYPCTYLNIECLTSDSSSISANNGCSSTATTLTEFVAMLNIDFSIFGKFTETNGNVSIELSSIIASVMRCASGSMIFQIYTRD